MTSGQQKVRSQDFRFGSCGSAWSRQGLRHQEECQAESWESRRWYYVNVERVSLKSWNVALLAMHWHPASFLRKFNPKLWSSWSVQTSVWRKVSVGKFRLGPLFIFEISQTADICREIPVAGWVWLWKVRNPLGHWKSRLDSTLEVRYPSSQWTVDSVCIPLLK